MPPTNHSPDAIFLKNLTLRSWFYKFPFGRCSDGPLCLKPALRREQDGGSVEASASSRLGPLLFFFVSDFFLFVFAITNTKDPVEKTFCFTGNKKIIYASVKCKKKLTSPHHAAKPGLSGVYRNRHRWLLYFYTPLRWEEWKDSPNRQNPIALYHVSGVDE